MKKLILLLLVLAGCAGNSETRKNLSLEGEWKFRIDSLDRGIAEEWYREVSGEPFVLPGSMAENGKGDEVTMNTAWTGDIVDRSYFTDEKYAKYRVAGNIKIPFWLKPEKHYVGVSWYQREFEIPDDTDGKNFFLSLERPHWETTVFVNGKRAGSMNSLAAPHEYDLTGLVSKGKNVLSIRVDNRIVIPVGVNSHSISDHTQSNWNGIAGKIKLSEIPDVHISDIQIFPDVKNSRARVMVEIANNRKLPFEGKLSVSAESFNQGKPQRVRGRSVEVSSSSDRIQMIIDYPMGDNFIEWSEYSPGLYRLSAVLKEKGRVIDTGSEDFGMREFRAEGTRFTVNGDPVFLRGTTECCVFPLTGYPPSDFDAWERIFRICRDHGLNHMRFHSYCPPEAAFEAADRLGVYLHVECSSWANSGTALGKGGALDEFIYDEGDRILKEYGNHPSFCMLAYGNEPAGNRMNEYLGKLLRYWKEKDNRRVYTSAAGWPVIPENDYNLLPGPRIQQWGEGLKSIINSRPPQTMFDFSDFLKKYTIPVVSHEIGQWCVYPDFKEIDKYSGILKAANFEIFRETLAENNMGDQAEQFLMASGKLQALCYKAEVEAALRSPGFAGFQVLQLHDFPGQGTALVGILNPFFEEKGYLTPEEFRMFCNETVPLARIRKLVLGSSDTLQADIELFHFGAAPLKNAVIRCSLKKEGGVTIFDNQFEMQEVPRGNCIPVGSISYGLAEINEASRLILEVKIDGTPYLNRWDIWVYPVAGEAERGDVTVTDRPAEALAALRKGGKVLLLTHGRISPEKGGDIAIGFSSIFWNTAWTRNQAPHTLGILCDPSHPVFSDFPTEYHSNWQWWDPVSHSQAMVINDFPAGMKPLIQPIDTWFENRRLALAFESLTEGGKLLVCSIDIDDAGTDRPSSRQLYRSILKYMNSGSFDPQVKVDAGKITGLM